jgi:peptidoglycan/xylan/chitin deacetylase (PgdA/CDA1 family)
VNFGMPWPSAGDRYRYAPITGRQAGRWPRGKGLAVYVALGVEEYRFGDGHTEDLLPGVPFPDMVNTSWRDYGNRVGAFRVLDRLARYRIPPTVLLNTMVYDSAPDVATAARRHRAEIVAHGISNSDSLAGLTQPEERAYVDAVARRITEEEGGRPGGWSSPWLSHTESTPDVLAAAGYRYLLDLRPDDQPVWLATTSAPLLAIPYALEINDSSTVIGRQASASEFADMIVDEFDELLGAAQDHPLVMSIVLHSYISGAPFRLRRLERALAHLHAHADQVWFTQPGEIHRAFAALSPPPLRDADDAARALD